MVKDLSNLPTVDPAPERNSLGVWPIREPTIGPILAEAWFKAREHDDHLAHAIPDAGWMRGSYAGACARQIMYKRDGIEESDPPTIADHWRMDLGSMVHEELQDAITAVMPDSEHEVAVDLGGTGLPGSMRIDTVNPLGNDEVETVEIKTINGFGYKAAATSWKKTGPEGPRTNAVVQAALGAVALQYERPDIGVKGARIVYLSLENLSPKVAKEVGYGTEVSRFCAEWFIPYDQCVAIVEREADRLIKADIEYNDGSVWDVTPTLPENVYSAPKLLTILNPQTGAAVDEDGNGAKPWACNYCSYQSMCRID